MSIHPNDRRHRLAKLFFLSATPTGSQDERAMTLIQNEKQTVLVALATVFAVLPTGAVGLRIYARRASGKRMQLSDGLIVLDNVAMLAYWILVIYTTLVAGTKDGDLRTNTELAKTDMGFYLSYHRIETAIKLVWALLVYLLKFSTLALLPEIFFSCSKAVRWTIRIASIVCASASITATLYIDSPTERWCDLTNPPMDMRKMNKVNGIFNTVTTVVLDFAIFCVPIWQLVSIRLKSRRKTLIIASFALGFTTCVVALVRTILVYTNQTKPLNALVQSFLLGLEPSVGIIAVSIPLFRRLFHRNTKPEGVKMHRLPSRAGPLGGPGDPESGIKSATTIVASSHASQPR
ncbi:hypothetical protein PG996_005297 [Apiospora saccharicola]|uniref:Rhodopsin domain-containing protein n=1 Tax=Apiospora saccharicola TaxID=335842 RepID=A0ABR1VL16_9PEZI